MAEHSEIAHDRGRLPAASGPAQASRDERAPDVGGGPALITTEQLRVGYATALCCTAEDRLYRRVRELLRDTVDELREQLHDLDPHLTLTCVND